MAPNYSRPYVHPLSKSVPSSPAPVATGGKRQPDSARGPKLPRTVRVKAHTRTVAPRAPQAPANPDQALIDAAVRSRFAPQEQALNQQLQQNTRYTSGLGDWYTNALNEIRGLQAQGQTQTQQTLGQLGQYNSQAVLANPNDQQAANARNNLNAEFAAQQGQVGQANSGAMDRLMAAFLLQQGNTQNQANRDRSQLLGQQGQLKGQEGDFRTTYGAQLQSAEQKAANDQTKLDLASKALGIKAKTLNQVQIPLEQSLTKDRLAKQRVARANARTQRIKARNQQMNNNRQFQLDKQKFGLAQAKQNWQQAHPNTSASQQKTAADLKYFKQHGYYPPTGPPKTGTNAPLTQGQSKARQQVLDAFGKYRSHGWAPGKQGDTKLSDIVKDGLSHGVSKPVISAGSELATKGYITGQTVRDLADIGISVPKAWTRRGGFKG